MTVQTWLRRLSPDPYVLAIMFMVALATIAPVSGPTASALGLGTKFAIGGLFFLHGAKLSREAVIAGLSHWRLHLTVLASTFLLFPILGLAARRLPTSIMSDALSAGVLFLCCLPSTVQSSIAFTSMARGNVAASVCAASASNLLGILVTPLLGAVLLGSSGHGNALDAIAAIGTQLFLPFAGGQVARPWIRAWLERQKRLVSYIDRGSILLVVYGAFSTAVTDGLWTKVSGPEVLRLAVVCGILLAGMIAATLFIARSMGFPMADQIAIVFCGSKKSLASGVPMASILFPAPMVGMLVLPLMIFHQMQLMACAVLAQHWAARPIDES